MNNIAYAITQNAETLRDALIAAALFVIPVAAQTAVAFLRGAIKRIETTLNENTKLTKQNRSINQDTNARLLRVETRINEIETHDANRRRESSQQNTEAEATE